jgi:hypothetical protein
MVKRKTQAKRLTRKLKALREEMRRRRWHASRWPATIILAASKAGISERSARRIESLEALPSQRSA